MTPTTSPMEQLLVDAAMGGTKSGVDLVGVVSIPGHIVSRLDGRHLRSYHRAQLEILMQVPQKTGPCKVHIDVDSNQDSSSV